MRRFALVLVVLGCVLLGVTVVVATRPDRAPARVARVLRAVPRALNPMPMPELLRRRLDELVAHAFLRPRPMKPRILRPIKPRSITAPPAAVAPGGSCDVTAGACSLHPCVTYAGAASQTAVLRSSGILAVLPQVLARPRPAPTLIVPIPGRGRAAGHRCVSTVPAQRLVSARIASAG